MSVHVQRLTKGVLIGIDDDVATYESPQQCACLLAGLEVALAAALREAGSGRCLKCGHVVRTAHWDKSTEIGYFGWTHCTECSGILAPISEDK